MGEENLNQKMDRSELRNHDMKESEGFISDAAKHMIPFPAAVKSSSINKASLEGKK